MPMTRDQQQELTNLVSSSIEKCFIENHDLITKIADIVVKQIADKIDVQLKKYETKINFLCDENKKLQNKIDILEQGNKKNNIRISGLNEVDGENLKQRVVELFHNKLKINMSIDTMDCFRHKFDDNAKSKPITVKFQHYTDKMLVIKNKKLLKNSKIFISEDLTKQRVLLLNEARGKFGKTKVWTLHGEIYALINNTRTHLPSLDHFRNFSS